VMSQQGFFFLLTDDGKHLLCHQRRSSFSAPADSLWIQLKALNTKWFESNCKRMPDD